MSFYYTLLSDCEAYEGTIGTIKTTLSKYLKGSIIDVSHSIPRHDVQAAAYNLRCQASNFPAGTINISLVGAFYENEVTFLLTKFQGNIFITPDNGTLSLAFGPDITAWTLFRHSWTSSLKMAMVSLGEAIDKFNHGGTFVATSPKLLHGRTFIVKHDWIECPIIQVDNFGNLVLAFNMDDFNRLIGNAQFKISLVKGKEATMVCCGYHEVEEKQLLIRFNSLGLMELAISRGRASDLLGISSAASLPSNSSIKIELLR